MRHWLSAPPPFDASSFVAPEGALTDVTRPTARAAAR